MQRRCRVAFGPEVPGFGSWDWVGADLCEALGEFHQTFTFRDVIPACDVVVFVKFHPTADRLASQDRPAVIYAPIDYYDSAARIDQDAPFLQSCQAIVIHSHRLRKYFSGYAPIYYLDHHLKYTVPPKSEPLTSGPILWTGVRTNLAPIVAWANSTDLPEELWVLTNHEDPKQNLSPSDYGFRNQNRVRLEHWTPQKHLEWLTLARVAVDLKGRDFRSRHKPPTKACDLIAAGVPLAMNIGTSPGEYFRNRGFELCDVRDTDRWFSNAYWRETQEMGQQLRRTNCLSEVVNQLNSLLATTLNHSS